MGRPTHERRRQPRLVGRVGIGVVGGQALRRRNGQHAALGQAVGVGVGGGRLVGQAVGVDVVELERRRERSGGVGRAGPRAPDREAEQHVHRLAHVGGGGHARGLNAVDVPDHVVRIPLEAVGMELVGIIDVDRNTGPLRLGGILGVDGLVDRRGVLAQGLEDVELGRERVVGRQQPEARPEAVAGRHLGADLEVSVLLVEGGLGGQQARCVLIAGQVLEVPAGGLVGGDAEYAVVDRERVEAERSRSRALVAWVDVELPVAVVGQGAGAGGRAAAAEGGPPGAALAVEAERVELVVEGEVQPRRVQTQHEVLTAQIGDLVIAQHQFLARREVQRHVRAHLGHRRLDVGEGVHAETAKPDPVDARLEVVDHVVAVALAHHEDVGPGSPDQDVVSALAVEGLLSLVAPDDVVERVSPRIGEVAQHLQVLDVVRQGEGQGRLDGVDPLAGILHRLVVRVPDEIGVVAGPAHQRVAAGVATESVILCGAGQQFGGRGPDNRVSRGAAVIQPRAIRAELSLSHGPPPSTGTISAKTVQTSD